jgi:PhnB protein
MANVKPIPDNYPRVTPYLTVAGGADAIDFYVTVLGATERMRMPAPDGKIGHAELEIGNSMIMLSDEFPEMGGKSPTTIGGSPVTVMVFVEDVDSVFEKALDNGGTAISKVEDQFYGDRAGTFEDPWGHKWHVASHVEDVPPDEMERRAAAAMGG